jgi:hypothetical protein
LIVSPSVIVAGPSIAANGKAADDAIRIEAADRRARARRMAA